MGGRVRFAASAGGRVTATHHPRPPAALASHAGWLLYLLHPLAGGSRAAAGARRDRLAHTGEGTTSKLI